MSGYTVTWCGPHHGPYNDVVREPYIAFVHACDPWRGRREPGAVGVTWCYDDGLPWTGEMYQ
jgi:hypothetical protein